MNLEDLTLEKAIDNELNIGDRIFMDDIIDNIEDNEFNDLIINETEATEFIQKLINDTAISDDEFECKYQHIRDDVAYQLREFGEVDLDEIAEFHGPVVYDLYTKYLGDD
jgi:hypothetical protein